MEKLEWKWMEKTLTEFATKQISQEYGFSSKNQAKCCNYSLL